MLNMWYGLSGWVAGSKKTVTERWKLKGRQSTLWMAKHLIKLLSAYYHPIPQLAYPFPYWGTFISSFWLLRRKMLCIHLYKHLCGYMLSLLLVKYLEMKWVGHMAAECLNFKETNKTIFQSDCAILHSYQQWMRVPHPCQHLIMVNLLNFNYFN